MRFDVLTLFPGIFEGYLQQGLLKRAIDAGLVSVQLWNFRDWATDRHKSVDDTPYGGGPGVLGDETSAKYDSFAAAGQLEYPQYTRPREFRGMTVPEVLLSGNHQEIAKWRAEQSARRTLERVDAKGRDADPADFKD